MSDVARFAQVVGQSVAKIPEPEDPGVIAWMELFGVNIPVGFQFASAAGLEGPLAFLLDIATDPTTYLGTGVAKVGKLTKLGEAARAATRGVKAVQTGERGAAYFRKAEAIADLTRSLEGRTPAEIAKVYQRVAGTGAKLETKSFRQVLQHLDAENPKRTLQVLDDIVEGGSRGASALTPHQTDITRIRELVARGKVDEAKRLVEGEIVRREALKTKLASYASAIEKGSPRDIRRTGKALRKLKAGPAVELVAGRRATEEAAQLAELYQRTGRAPGRLGVTLGSQAEKGQRAAFAVRVPFSDSEIVVATGQPLFDLMDKLKAQAPSLNFRPLRTGLTGLKGAPSKAVASALLASRGAASLETVASSASASVEALKGARTPAVYAANNMNDVRIGEVNLSKVMAETLRRELTSFLPDDALRQDLLEEIITSPANLLEKAVEAGPAGDDIKDTAVILAGALEDSFDEAQKLGTIEAHLESYFPRIVRKVNKQKEYQKFLDETVPQFTGQLTGTTRHARQRQIHLWDDFFQLEKDGVIEIEKDPAQVIAEYMANLGRAMADGRYRDAMLANPVILEGVEEVDAALPRILDAISYRKAQKTLGTESDALAAAYTYVPKLRSGYTHKADGYIAALMKGSRRTRFLDEVPGHPAGFYVRSEELKPMRRMFDPGVSSVAVEGERITDKLVRNGLFMNGLTKRIQLAFSAFHYVTLTESGTAAVGLPFLKNLAKDIKDIPGALGEFVAKGEVAKKRFPHLKEVADFYGNMDVVKEAVAHGVQLGALPVAEQEVLMRAFGMAASWGKALGLDKKALPVAVATGLQKRIMNWDRGMWDVFHNGSKLFAYNELVTQGIRRAPGVPVSQIRKATAAYVNNAFGGQIWEKFFLGRPGQQLMRLMLFAPDWTISNMRVAIDVFGNFAKRAINVPLELASAIDEPALLGLRTQGVERMYNRIARTGGAVFSAESILQSDIRALYARQYALRAGLMAVGFGNLLNMAFSGHTMNDNAEGRKRMIELPYKSEGGRRSYLAIFKQFREPFEMWESPLRFFRLKSAIASRGVINVATEEDVFGRPITGQDDGPARRIGKLIGHIGGSALPFPAQEFFGVGGRSASEAFTAERLAETAVTQIGLPIRKEFSRGKISGEQEKRARIAIPVF